MCESSVENVLHSTSGLTGNCPLQNLPNIWSHPKGTRGHMNSRVNRSSCRIKLVPLLLKPSNTLFLPCLTWECPKDLLLLFPLTAVLQDELDEHRLKSGNCGSSKVCLCLSAIMTVSMGFILTMLR